MQMEAQKRYIPIFNINARWGWLVNTTPRLLYPRTGEPVPIVQDVGS